MNMEKKIKNKERTHKINQVWQFAYKNPIGANTIFYIITNR